MKYIILIGDGMADNPIEQLGGKTPLECAKKPCMDLLAKKGEQASVLTVPKGVEPGSDTAILSIFGYNPKEYYSGRSPLEAAGSGVELKTGDISYRCNMISLEDGNLEFADKKIISHSGGSIDGESSIALLRTLLADKEFSECAQKNNMVFYESPSFRHIAVQKNVNIAGLIAYPPHDHLNEKAGKYLAEGAPAADGLNKLMEIANKILDDHYINKERRKNGKLPANGIWFWAEGSAIKLPNFKQKYNKNGFVVSAVPLVKGIGALAGIPYVEVEGATGELDTNYNAKAAAVIKGLAEGNDFAVLHIEAPDECTHNGDLNGKIKAIENIDNLCLKPLIENLDNAGEDYRILILSDHKTLISTRGHDGDPVPYIIYDSCGTDNTSNLNYSEKNAEKGNFIEEGHTLIERLFGY